MTEERIRQKLDRALSEGLLLACRMKTGISDIGTVRKIDPETYDVFDFVPRTIVAPDEYQGIAYLPNGSEREMSFVVENFIEVFIAE
ncbi:hypothetical protein [Dyadobacter psychrotolerans]|uniref:Uncharacterized protein n=1 Tax=Dyadobacter psychrotolerans TaxID=2541721 RepID=A0A4R5DTW7_9BACT|nr:hypothetical protein [Dyadobacter psychrotolerans]TDE15551.1 hypothetical protein E0F88_13690 [Dyadobacter psychrotolerans]